MYETLSSSVSYGGLTLKNRIIFAPTSLGLSPEEETARLAGIARGAAP